MTKVLEKIEEKNEIMVKEDNYVSIQNEDSLFSDLAKNTYCSIDLQDDKNKEIFINALEECDIILNDIQNEIINVKDVYCEEYQKLDDETGEVKNKYRTILFDMDGKTYVTAAYGIFNSLKRIFFVYGLPTWENGLKLQVIKKSSGGKTSLGLKKVS